MILAQNGKFAPPHGRYEGKPGKPAASVIVQGFTRFPRAGVIPSLPFELHSTGPQESIAKTLSLANVLFDQAFYEAKKGDFGGS